MWNKKYPCCLIIITALLKTHGLTRHFLQRPHWAIFTTPNDYCSALSMIEFVPVKNTWQDCEKAMWFMQDSPRLHRTAEVLHFLTSKIH